MTPTVFRHKGYRFFFFSREESRMHVHVQAGHGEAKFWVGPGIETAQQYGFGDSEVHKLKRIAEERIDEIISSWREHFGT